MGAEEVDGVGLPTADEDVATPIAQRRGLVEEFPLFLHLQLYIG
jgi:hypothetical protein